jgi:hypothetical protein
MPAVRRAPDDQDRAATARPGEGNQSARRRDTSRLFGGRAPAVIRIRYSGLPPGLHARAEAQGRSTVIYLLPGLPAADRRAALRRLRRTGAMGYGPRLPAAGVAVAMVLDRARAVSRACARLFQAHPYLVLPPTIIAVTAGLATVLAAATVMAIRGPAGGATGPGPGSSLGVVAPAPAPSGRPAHSAGAARSASAGLGAGGTRPGPPSRSRHPARSPGRSSSPSPSPSPSGTVPPSPPPSSPAPEPPDTGEPQPSPTPSASGACLNLGLFGICLPL